jgi:hypothetical protein
MTIELDLMKPAEAVRRAASLGWNAGFDEGEATQHTTYVNNLFDVARARQEWLDRRGLRRCITGLRYAAG